MADDRDGYGFEDFIEDFDGDDFCDDKEDEFFFFPFYSEVEIEDIDCDGSMTTSTVG